jgi:hypothetical protein
VRRTPTGSGSNGQIKEDEMSFDTGSNRRSPQLLFTVSLVIAMLIAALPVAAEPLTVATVTVNSPTMAAKSYVSAGNAFTVSYTATSDTGGSGQAKFYLGTTLIKTVNVTLVVPTTTLSESVTVPGGTAAALYDVMVEVKEDPQSNWVQGIAHDAVLVDNTAPVVPAAVVTSPNGGETWGIGTVHNITWNAGAITDPILAPNPISLYYSLDAGASWTLIASGEANDGAFSWTVPGPTSTQAQVKVEAMDLAGNKASDTSNANFTIHAVDPTVPGVTLTAPLDGAKIRGPALVSADAADPESGVAQVAFSYSLDGTTWIPLGAPDVSAPYFVTLDTTPLTDGATLWVRAVARNGVGAENADTNSGIVVDNSAPAVSLSAPAAGSFLHGTVPVNATATDPHSGLASVLFQYQLGAGAWMDIGLDSSAPFSVNWNTTLGTDGAYKLRGIATNGSGLQTTSATTAVTVDNTPPAKTEQFLLHPNGGEVWQIGTTQQVTWDKNHIADVNLADNPIKIEYRYDGTWFLLADNEANDGSLNWNLTGLLSATDYRLRITVKDKAGNETTDSSNADFTVWAQDSTAPLVALTNPAAGAWLKGGVTVAATASDPESGIANMEFYWKTSGGWTKLDGTLWSPPYSVIWDTSALNGAAQLKAQARNGVGMTGEAIISVNLDNTLPVVAVTEPAEGSKVFGHTVPIAATASDAHSGLASVAFRFRSGGGAWQLLTTDTTAPYQLTWDSLTAPDGPGQIKATACDNVGHCADDINNIEVMNSFSKHLVPGWNMISLPLVPSHPGITDVLADLIAHDTVLQVRAWLWEGGALVEKMWVPDGPQSLTQMRDGQAYWIQMAAADVLTVDGLPLPPPPQLPPSYAVYIGWNHIGFTSTVDQSIPDYLGPELTAAAASLYGYDTSSGLYYIPPNFERGQGYWLGSTAAGTIFP